MFANLKLVILGTFIFSGSSAMAISETGQSLRARSTTVPAMHSPYVQADFIKTCMARGVQQELCTQMTSPNSQSKGIFRKVYGSQPFILMPPQNRWDEGIHLLTIAQSLAAYGNICEIRNWYRPEPYNRAVDGAKSSQHLSAGAIDIQFCTVADKNKALQAALAMRQQHKSPAGVGAYGEGSLVLHIDMSDRIYGPGIAYVDSAVARNPAWSKIARPGSQLRPLARPASLNTAGSSPSNGPSSPAVERQDVTSFFRQILALFSLTQ